MRLPRREFMKATALGLAAGVRSTALLEAQGPKSDLVITFAGLCAFVPGKDEWKVGLVNACFNPALQLHPHRPILVARKIDVQSGSAPPENCLLKEWVAGWTKLGSEALAWWPLDGAAVSVSNSDPGKPETGIFNREVNKIGSVKSALNGGCHEYPGKNPLHKDWPTREVNGRRLASSVVTLHGGKIRNGEARIKCAEKIKWQFKDRNNRDRDNRKAHKQVLTDTVRYELDRETQVHLIQVGNDRTILLKSDGEDVECWILNVSFDQHQSSEQEKQELWHFAAFYDLLEKTVPKDERPVPTTDEDYKMEVEFDMSVAAVSPVSSDRKAATETVYCPGALF